VPVPLFWEDHESDRHAEERALSAKMTSLVGGMLELGGGEGGPSCNSTPLIFIHRVVVVFLGVEDRIV